MSGSGEKAQKREMRVPGTNFTRLSKGSVNGRDQWDSVVWASVCKVKGYRFDSQSGHRPGLWARSQLEAWERQTIDVSFPFVLPPFPLSKNTYIHTYIHKICKGSGSKLSLPRMGSWAWC